MSIPSPAEKPELLFILENKLGGISSFNRNLINFTSLRDRFYIRLLWIETGAGDPEKFTDEIRAHKTETFTYQLHENRYSVLRRLQERFGTAPGAVICNDGLEMEAIYQFGTSKTVYQLVHDFYNLKLAVKFGAIVDVYVCHSKMFRDVLFSSAPDLVKSFWIPQGVEISAATRPKPDTTGALRLVFAGRLTEGKGVLDLFSIDELLRVKDITVNWTIIGKGHLKSTLTEQWAAKKNIRFASPETAQEVVSLMREHDLFVFPTRFEGSPVALHEALSAGLVPVVSDLPGGIEEIVSKEIGHRVPVGDIAAFADSIAFFNSNREALAVFSATAYRFAREQLDIRDAADKYFSLFGRYAEFKESRRNLPAMKVGFRLDQKWLPGGFVSFIRRLSAPGAQKKPAGR